MPRFIPSDQHVIVFHGLFALVAAAILSAPLDTNLGVRLFVLVVFYNMALPMAAHQFQHPNWIRIWLFLVPLSALQILPDAFLASQLQVLVFPDLGGPRIGPVSAAMAGMWTIPLFLVVYAGERLRAEGTQATALYGVAALSFILFVGAEATLWTIPIWYAQNVWTVAHVAVYVVVPEVLLGLSAYIACERLSGRSPALQLLGAATVMSLYLGNLCLFYLLIEGDLWSSLG